VTTTIADPSTVQLTILAPLATATEFAVAQADSPSAGLGLLDAPPVDWLNAAAPANADRSAAVAARWRAAIAPPPTTAAAATSHNTIAKATTHSEADPRSPSRLEPWRSAFTTRTRQSPSLRRPAPGSH